MATEAAASGDLVQVVALLAAGVVAVPIFKRIGLGSVLGYLTAGLIIGPFGLGLFSDPEAVLHVAELGVVMFLFIIGLEMQPSRLWGLRRAIFGLGAIQVAVCAFVLTLVGIAFGLSPLVAFVGASGFVLSSTAIVMQILEERGETATDSGQKVVSILLMEDLMIVPLLALIAFLAPGGEETTMAERWTSIGIALGSVAALVAAGRWLLNPMFRILAEAHAREVMTAAALLVVLGAALAMQLGGLSMAMGAFLAGVLLSESTFRHQLEADVEPFRGILLGLFFLGVGMSLDLSVIAASWPLIIGLVVAFMIAKGIAIYLIARVLKASHRTALTRAALMAQGGEFAFVLYAAATSTGILDGETNAAMTATVILSIALTPFLVMGLRFVLPQDEVSLEGVEAAADLRGRVLVIGFGRFGQIVSQPLLLRGVDVSIIDNDVEMIQAAADFGFKVYYGDGTRPEILHAAGANHAEAILICIDQPDAAVKIAEMAQMEFPLTKVLSRAFDRGAAIRLIKAGVEYQIRETLESALSFAEATLETLGVPDEEAEEILDDVRSRDAERLQLQVAGDIYAGTGLLQRNTPVPAPLSTPRRAGRALNEETEDLLRGGDAEKRPAEDGREPS
ncbi:MAG: monovalent cation:proton antiporter-2 (CPA2) family protein [Rhizobiaceae bacterium]